MIVAEIKGNLLDTDIVNIAHGVNCQNVMESGVAKALYEKWPEVKERYHDHCNYMYNKTGAAFDLLGTLGICTIKNKTIFNCFAQLSYGREAKNGIIYVNYEAIRECFSKLVNTWEINSIAIPKIGCGLAGGDWEKVKEIINEATENNLDVYVYYL